MSKSYEYEPCESTESAKSCVILEKLESCNLRNKPQTRNKYSSVQIRLQKFQLFSSYEAQYSTAISLRATFPSIARREDAQFSEKNKSRCEEIEAKRNATLIGGKASFDSPIISPAYLASDWAPDGWIGNLTYVLTTPRGHLTPKTSNSGSNQLVPILSFQELTGTLYVVVVVCFFFFQ